MGMTEYIITCQSELQNDGSYKIERYRELIRCRDCDYYLQANHCALMHKPIGADDSWFCAEGRKHKGGAE